MNQTPTSTMEIAAQTCRATPDPWSDVYGTHIVLWDWVEQVTQDKEPRALPIRLHQRGQVVGLGANALYVRFEHHNHLIALRPDHVRLLCTSEGC